MRIPATSPVTGAKQAPLGAPRELKSSIKTKDFRAAWSRLAPSARSERPVGAEVAESKKRIAPSPTDRAPSEGLARQSKRGIDGELEPLDRSGEAYDPLALLANAVTSREPVGGPAPSPSPSSAWVNETIRRIAWGGDRQRGTARVELGAGPYAGSALQLQAEGSVLKLEVTAPPGVDARALAEQIGARLTERGLRLDSVRVR